MNSSDIQRAYDEARFFMANGRLAEAAGRCNQVLAAEPEHAGGLFLRGVIALEQRNPLLAADALERATRANPNSAEYHAQLARSLIFCRRHEAARRAAERAMELAPDDALSLDTLGVVFSHLGAHDRAADVFRRASAMQPRNASYQYNLGTSLTFAGQPEEAEQAFEQALKLQPGLHKAHYALSHARRQTADRNHIEALREVWQTAQGDPEGLLYLGYALAKECDDVGDYESAWHALSSTNREWNERSGYQPDQDVRLFDALTGAFDTAQPPSAGHESSEPIFMLGLPRSGTTLTDRILSSHSQVQSAGELNNLGLIVKQFSGSASGPLIDADIARRSANLPFADVGRRYLDSTRPLTGETARFIDKLPHNFLYLGVILAALPKAKVICLRRHPLDVCLGNFRQLFATGHPYFAYSYDLLNCGRYFVGFDRLMRHWQQLYPGRIFELHYEDLVANQEDATRRLLDYCGLPWEAACLDFANNTAPVATASSSQVREPLNARGIGRWQHYESHLQPLIRLLRGAGIAPLD